MFEIQVTPEAIDDLRAFSKSEQQRIFGEIERQLPHQALNETRNRKKLRPNDVAEWELRIGDFRVFYDVDEVGQMVRIVAVGYKRGGKLFLHGEEFEL